MPVFFVFGTKATYADLFNSANGFRVGIQTDDLTAFENWAISAGAAADFDTVPLTQNERLVALLNEEIAFIAITYQESARQIAAAYDFLTLVDQDGNVMSKERPDDWVTRGTAGDDSFTEVDGDQRIDGGDGEDRMFFHQPFENY